jgi:hypothetical protein
VAGTWGGSNVGSDVGILLMQNEVANPAVVDAAEIAHRAGKLVIFKASPIRSVSARGTCFIHHACAHGTCIMHHALWILDRCSRKEGLIKRRCSHIL